MDRPGAQSEQTHQSAIPEAAVPLPLQSQMLEGVEPRGELLLAQGCLDEPPWEMARLSCTRRRGAKQPKAREKSQAKRRVSH